MGAARKLGRSKIAEAAAAPQVVNIDPDAVTRQIPPRTTHQFTTALIRTHAHDEERDEETGEVTRPAALELEFVSPAIIAQVGDQILAHGGEAYRTELSPAFAIAVLTDALAEAERVQATMKEQPLQSTSLAIAHGAEDVAAAAAGHELAEQLKNGDGPARPATP